MSKQWVLSEKGQEESGNTWILIWVLVNSHIYTYIKVTYIFFLHLYVHELCSMYTYTYLR